MCMYIEDDFVASYEVPKESPMYGYKYLRRETGVNHERYWVSPFHYQPWWNGQWIESNGPSYRGADPLHKRSHKGFYCYKNKEQAEEMREWSEDVKRIAIWGTVWFFSCKHRCYTSQNDGYLAQYAMVVDDEKEE